MELSDLEKTALKKILQRAPAHGELNINTIASNLKTNEIVNDADIVLPDGSSASYPYAKHVFNISKYLLENGFTESDPNSFDYSIKFTDKGRQLKKLGGLDEYLRYEAKQAKKEERKERREIVFKWVGIILTVISITIAYLSYHLNASTKEQKKELQDSIQTLRIQLNQKIDSIKRSQNDLNLPRQTIDTIRKKQ